MKKNLLSKLACILSLVLCISTISTKAYATTNDKSTLTKPEQQELKEHVDSLSDKEFDEFLLDYINTNKNNGKDFTVIQADLASIGVELSDGNDKSNSTNINARYISPGTVTISTYTSRRSGESFIRLYGQVTHNSTEYYPGSLDLLSVEWDYSKASYYSSSTGGYATYMDGSNRHKGICLFNVDDKRMFSGDEAYGIVYVTPKASSGTWIDFASKYIHTYKTTGINWSIGGNLNYSAAGPTGGLSFTISGDSALNSWQLYSDNSFKAW